MQTYNNILSHAIDVMKQSSVLCIDWGRKENNSRKQMISKVLENKTEDASSRVISFRRIKAICLSASTTLASPMKFPEMKK